MNHHSVSKFSKALILIALCTFFSFEIYAQQRVGRQMVDQYPTTAWGTKTFGLTWLPNDYNSSTEKYPLIIFLHGMGETGNGVGGLGRLISTALPQKIAQGWNPRAVNPVDGKTYDFIVVSPQAPRASQWSYGFGSVQWILADVLKRYRVDPSRIYITGLSAGGAGTWGMVTNTPAIAQKIAAIVPVAAAGTNTPAEKAQLHKVGGAYGVKVWNVCGEKDAWYAFADYATKTINTARPAPKVPAAVTALKGLGHQTSAWNTAYDPNWRNNQFQMNIYEWMLRSPRGQNNGGGEEQNNGDDDDENEEETPNEAPEVNTIGDQTITLPENSLTISGVATDDDGSVVKYAWTTVSGPSAPQFSNRSAANTIVSDLEAGTYVFRLTVTDNKGAQDSDDIRVTVKPKVVVPPPPPVVPNVPSLLYTLIPERIQAESWSAMSGVQTEQTGDFDGELNVGWVDQDDWMEYRIRNLSAGVYTASFRVAAADANGRFKVLGENGTVLATVDVPQTRSYQSWITVFAGLELPEGDQTIRIVSTTPTVWNLNWIQFNRGGKVDDNNNNDNQNGEISNLPIISSVPKKIEAEDWSAMFGVKTENTRDVNAGLNVGWIDAKDWMDYKVNVTEAGTYEVRLRLATEVKNCQFDIRKADGSVLATVEVPQTLGYQKWVTVTTEINLSKGIQTLRLYSNRKPIWNINWMEFHKTEEDNYLVESSALAEEAQVETAPAAASLSIYPNPVADRMVVQVTGEKTGNGKVQVVDMNGVVVKEFRFNKVNNGTSQNYFSVQGLKAGQYILRVQLGDWIQSTKMVKR